MKQLETIFLTYYVHVASILWSATKSLNFTTFFLPLPTHHTHFPFFTDHGYVFCQEWPMVRGRASRLCSGMDRQMVILGKVAELPYNLLSEMSERVISCPLQSRLIRKLYLLFLEQNKTVCYHYINKVGK